MYRIFLLISLFLSGISFPTLSAHGDLIEQIDQLTKEIALAVDNANLYVQRGQLYAQHQEYPAAISDFRKARQLQTDLFLTDLLLAKVFADQKHPKIALASINTFLTTRPIHIDGLIIRAGIYQQLGKNVAAQKDFEQAIRHNNQVQPKHYIAIAENFLSADSSNITPALDWLNKGQAQFGFDIVLKQKEVDLLMHYKLYDKALQSIEVILTHFPRKEKWLFQKGQIFEKSQAPKKAWIEYEATLAAIAQLPKRVQLTKRMLALEAKTIERLQMIKKFTSK